MSDTDPQHPPFLRRVSFVDPVADDPTQTPVTVPSRLFLDGVEHPEVLARTSGQMYGDWQVVGDAVLVSFVAYAEHVTMQSYPVGKSDLEALSGSHIAGIPVLTPTDHDWELLPSDDQGRGLVRVWFFARHVEVLAINQLQQADELHADAVS
jgi:hypothetical protein